MINFGNPVFKRLTDVVYLDEHDCPIVDTVYINRQGMWQPGFQL